MARGVAAVHFALELRDEPIFRSIGEATAGGLALQHPEWFSILLAGWALLLLWRWRKRRIDRVEAVLS